MIRTPLLVLWTILIACVAVGSLLPAASPVLLEVGRLHISDKLLHFGAYLTLSFLPVVALRDRRNGLFAAASMFLLSALLEAGQTLSPGRAVELGDLLANAFGVISGILLASPLRPRRTPQIATANPPSPTEPVLR